MNNKSKLNTIDYKTLANEIFISQLKNIKAYDKPISIFLMGIPASGKSTVIVDFIKYLNMKSNNSRSRNSRGSNSRGSNSRGKNSSNIKIGDFFHIDPDICMKELPGYTNNNAENYNKHGVILANTLLNVIYDKAKRDSITLNYIYYGTGKNYKSYMTMINKSKKLGYTTILIDVRLNIDIAINRSTKRARIVKENIIREISKRLSQKETKGKYTGKTNYEILKSLSSLDLSFICDNSNENPNFVKNNN